MKDRFAGTAGRANLLDALAQQRSAQHGTTVPPRPPSLVPIIIIGSSVGGLPVVAEIESAFRLDRSLALHPWTKDVFGPSGLPVDELLAEVEKADFALFVFGPDDRIASRGKTHHA